jgi:RNA polymerase sigma factor (sigma-70 family)
MASQDRELAQRCQRGDADAYAELVRRHRRMVYGVAYAIVVCSDDAEDVVQEAFLRAYGAIGRYNPRYEFAGWIRRITVNCAVSKLRQQERTRRLVQAGAAQANPAPAPTPAEQLVATELQGQVRRAVDSLPLNQRLAITLFALEDMDLAGTAQAIGCSVGAVKSHLHRARQKLAQMLSEHIEEE